MDGTRAGAAPAPLTHRQILVVFSGLLLAMLLAALDSTIVATALPTIVGELGGLTHLAWVVTAYLLAQTIVTPLYGKLGDLYGRKIVLQSAIVIFLVGSVLCGLATSMTQLIVFRAVQGLGGGGLMVTTMAVVGDIVPPRERGRYQGIFGAVFGISSIAGPLLGGYFTTQLSWRWIFYINLPLGALAMVVLAATLPSRADRVRHTVDYLGAALLAVALSSVVLVTDLGGVTYPWGSPPILGLAALAVLTLGAFIWTESRAPEPVLPLRLFRERTFVLCSLIGLIVGVSLFGSVTYLPLFLQVVNGATPTGSGLQMIPMMGGMLFTSIISGQLISRWGRYKPFPIAGMLLISLGLFLLSRMSGATTILGASVAMAVLGFGLGLVMQVLVIAVQNAVDYSELGVATSGTTLFRLIGGSLGTAVFGAIFASRLQANLAHALPGGAPPASVGVSPQMLSRLAPALREVYVHAFTSALGSVFFTAGAFALIGFVLTWLVPERPLRETVAAVARDIGTESEIFPMPVSSDSIRELERALSLVASRDVRREYIQAVVARAGLDLSPAAAFLLVRIDEDPATELGLLSRTYGVESTRLLAAEEELRQKRLLAPGTRARRALTLDGCQALSRLVGARRDRLTELLADWPPSKREELARVIDGLAHELVPDSRAKVG